MYFVTEKYSPNAGEADTARSPDILVNIQNLTKRYGLATVVDNVSFEIRTGEIHAIVGENGAGKSTIAKCLAGFVRPDQGGASIDGQTITNASVREAEKNGIVLIHQELALAEHLTAADNMFLGHELNQKSVLRSREMVRRAGEMLKRLGCPASPNATVSTLAISDKQMVEIAKALLRKARLIIMDEPTAVLTPREAEHLFRQIERLKSENVSVIFVSHKLDEVKRIADRVTILRDGRYQGTWRTEDLTTEQIANLMVGRELSQIYPPKRSAGTNIPALEVENFSGRVSKAPATFSVFFGEIFGVAGLVGSGRTELFEALVGLDTKAGGRVFLRGQSFEGGSYKHALASGIVYVTEDRKGNGLLLEENIALNISLLEQSMNRDLLIDAQRERRSLQWAMRQFNIETPSPKTRVGRLSGGNQQKVLLAKSLLIEPGVIIVDEPTRGIDVGTRAQIYRMLRKLAENGHSVILISSDLQEIIGLSDRVMVMYDNQVAGMLTGDQITEQNIVQLATGVATSSGG